MSLRALRRVFLALSLLPAVLPAATNLIFNGGFELDSAGFELVRYQRIDRNPSLAFEPVVVDTTTFHSGARSLRVPNRHGEHAELFARGVTLKQGTRYSASVWMKSEIGGLSVTPTIISNSYYPAKARTFTVGTGWTKYAFTFTTGAAEVTGNAIWFAINRGEAVAANDLWIDDFQVYEDPSTSVGAAAFTYSADVEIAATVDKPYYQGAGNTAAVTLELNNAMSRAVSGAVDLRLEEDAGAAPQVVGTFTVALAAGERRVLTTTLPLPRYGSFTLTPVAQLDATAATLPAWFAAVPQYTPTQTHLNLDTTYCVGACMGLHSGRGARNTLRGCGGPATQALDVYAALGGRLARIWDAGHQFEWRTIEPTQGQMDFTQTDFLVDALYSRGISILPVLGGDFITLADGTYDTHSPFPQWLIDASPRSEHTAQWLTKLDPPIISFLPADSLWRSHVGALAQRYAGKITHWEINNEPDIWIPASEYMPYLKSASEVIKAADPAAKPLCFGAHGTFLNDCVALGAESYATINSVHPYGARALGSPDPADELLTSVKAATTMTPWVTELYYLAEGIEDGNPKYVRPIHVARRFLTDLGEGVGQSTPTNDPALWKRTLNPEFGSRDVNSSFTPSANLVAYDALACHFEGAKPKAKLRWGNDTICYVYERNGSPLAACWVYREGAADLAVTLPSAIAATTVLDVFGNTVASPGGAFTVVPMPQYLIPAAGVNTTDFIAALEAAPPLKVAATPGGVSGPGKGVLLQASVTPWPGRTISEVAFRANGSAIGSGSYNTTSRCWELNYTTSASATGQVTIGASATDNLGRSTRGTTTLVVGALGYGNSGQPRAVPTAGVIRIPAADFDQGGNGVAFLEKDTGNGDWLGRSGGTDREVDVYSSAVEGLKVGGILNGEWLNYTVSVPIAGKYDIRLRVANEVGSGLDGAQVSLKWKGTLVATKVVVPQTSDWDVYTDLAIAGVTLSAGVSQLQIYADTWGWAYAWLEIGPSVAEVAGNTAPTITTAEPASLGYQANGNGTLALAAADADGDALAWSIPLQPTHGTASVSSDGVVTYMPVAGFVGSESCQVRVADGRGGHDTIRVDCGLLPTAAVKPLAVPAVTGAPVLLAAEAIGASDVATVSYFADGVAIGVGVLADCGWGVVWTPTTAGPVPITARATDVNGVAGPLSAALAVKVVAKGTALTVTDDCGTVAPAVRAAANGLQATDHSATPPFGDATLFTPATTSAPGRVTWHVPNATAFWFSYALTAGQPGSVTVETSADGLSFATATPVAQAVGIADSWAIYDAAVTALPAGTSQIRVTLGATGAAQSSAVALLWVQIDSVAGGGAASTVVLPSDFRVTPTAIAGQGGEFQIVFGPVQSGWTYTPEFCTDLAAGNWVRLTAFTQSDSGTQRTITDLTATGARRFYRIRLVPAP